MSHSYCSNRIHLIFSTKERRKCLTDELQPKLWSYMAGIARNQGFEAMIIGGVWDHIHALLALPPAVSLAKAVQFLKGSSSHWINESRACDQRFAWQEGYGAFSVSPSQVSVVKKYIQNQEEHHLKRNFEEEFVALLRNCGIEYDERYVFG